MGVGISEVEVLPGGVLFGITAGMRQESTRTDSVRPTRPVVVCP